MGFSGAPILTFRGEPKTLFTKPEMPLFFRHRVFPPFASSEYLFDDVVKALSARGGVRSIPRSPMEKLADCLSKGVIIRGSGDVYEGGSGGRRGEYWELGVLALSRVFERLLSSGALIIS